MRALRPFAVTLAASLGVALVSVALRLPEVRAAEDMTRIEKAAQKEATKVARIYFGLAEDLADLDLPVEAEEAFRRAKKLDLELKGLDELEERIGALAGEGRADEKVTQRVKKAYVAAAKGYDKLAKVFSKEKLDPRYREYLVTALALDPTKGRKRRISDEAKKELFLLRSAAHPMAAYVSLPKSWKAGKTYPVLVSIDGAGSNFKGNGMAFRSGRGSREFITVAPHALSCTGEIKFDRYPAYPKELIHEWNGDRIGFDMPGLLALLDFLKEHFGAQEKVAITGFSGGGQLCYGFLLKHPDRVLCAAPACANFSAGLAPIATKPADGGPPIHVMTGEKDPHRYLTHGTTPPGIEQQTDEAVKVLEESGFQKVRRTLLPGVRHSSCVKQVWAFVDEVREGTE